MNAMKQNTPMDTAMVERALGGGDGSGALNPLRALPALVRLLEPKLAAREVGWITAELMKIGLGLSDIELSARDPLFGDPSWRKNPVFRRLAETHVALGRVLDHAIDNSKGDWKAHERAHYAANIVAGAVSPSNFLLTNPVALRRAIETGGMSVARGVRNMASDVVTNHAMPRSVDSRPFKIGENMACTPGAVVHREEMFELLQYTPTTKQVRQLPLLMVPPGLNRHYVLDLAPERSLVEFAVSQGVQTFCMVWRNPRPERAAEHGAWGLDDYVAAQVRAFDIVCDIAGSETLNLLGLCGGGVTSVVTQAYLAAQGVNPVQSATYLVTMLDARQPNMATMLDTPMTDRHLERQASKAKIIPAHKVANNFAWMRPRDLVYGYVVNNWLLGNTPPAFDVLAWNSDPTNMSARFARDCSRLLTRGLLVEPGAAVVAGTPLDLSKVITDNYLVIGERDHITTWRPCYQTSQLLGGPSQVVLVNSGHIQSFVNPPKTSHYKFHTAPAADRPDPDEWRAHAAVHDGSWWPNWAQWLLDRSGSSTPAPTRLGNDTNPAVGAAPGDYVHEK